ncbi:hypothetical protein LTS08_008735 [Lithohypha guttulata]|nr:hypothetical protein LTS08_008735 [Lithohypha guttulata]
MASSSFSKLPPTTSSSIKPFTITFPESDLQQLQDFLKLTPLPSQSYENSLPNGDRHLGLRLDWLSQAKKKWETDFDWRQVEGHLNSFPNFKAQVDDKLGTFSIHFAALFSAKPNAIPVLMLHGWPGYTFSTLPSSPLTDFDAADCARVLNTLVTSILKFPAYVVQGGDVGSRVARVMGAEHSACIAVHLNMCSMSQPPDSRIGHPISETEKQGLRRLEEWKATGTAYAMEHATRPATIGAVLASNPVALLAWIGEKFLDWTDKDPTIQTILEHVTLYWLTKCMHTNLWSYRHSYGPAAKPHDHPDWHLKKPLGYSYFPEELIPIPVAWVATTGELVHSAVHETGGHFAAMEEPEALWKDVEEFVNLVWKREMRL